MALIAFLLLFLLMVASPASAQVERIWLTHPTASLQVLSVNWETAKPGPSVVYYGLTERCEQAVRVEESATLHQVRIPVPRRGIYHYRVETGEQRSPVHTFKAYPDESLRVAVVADWQSRPNLDALIKDDIHLLLTAGDNINDLHSHCGPGVKDCLKPYRELIDAYPELFRSVPFMPALGNHDREIRPRGSKPPPEPVYDVEATAFRRFFPLPDDGWKWRFDVPAFDVRFIALDLNHISDQGTTWQTCHPFHQGSPQYNWYRSLMMKTDRKFVVTIQNERNAAMRQQENGEWGRMFRKGTAVISGFGYYAERAEVDGFPYFNTALGAGDKYPDPHSRFLHGEASYILMTLRKGSPRMRIEIKNLKGEALDRTEWPAQKNKLAKTENDS